MGRKLAAVALAVSVSLPAWADDPWKEKAYTEWTQEDVRKVLNDSPWARRVIVQAPWARDSRLGRITPQDRAPGAGSGQTLETSRPGGAESPAPAIQSEAAQIPEATFVVRWVSARTLRRAMVRAQQLRGALSAEEGEKQLAPEAPFYQVLVVGPDMTPFQKADEIQLKEKAQLRLKKSKQKLAPDRVEIHRSEDGKRVAAILFHFLKKTPAGEPTIAPDEKGIEFLCRAGGVSLKVTFELAKMAGREGADL